ncbi:MAG: 50S ribosomal protein L18 [Candidatus Bathyarchaeia archaeon]
MAKQASYCLPYRRRRNGKTDYRARKAFILSGKPRIVVRGSLRHMLAQVIAAKPHGDEVLVAAHSRELAKYGWKASEGNLPAAYLTGFLCGLKAKTEGVDEAILDVGLHSPTKGARIFAALKGVLDAGVEVPHSEEKLPENERIDGKHVAEYAKSLASIPESYQTRFSKYLEQKLSPENLPEIFANVKKEIAEEFKKGGKKA